MYYNATSGTGYYIPLDFDGSYESIPLDKDGKKTNSLYGVFHYKSVNSKDGGADQNEIIMFPVDFTNFPFYSGELGAFAHEMVHFAQFVLAPILLPGINAELPGYAPREAAIHTEGFYGSNGLYIPGANQIGKLIQQEYRAQGSWYSKWLR